MNNPRQLTLATDWSKPDWKLTDHERKVGLAYIQLTRKLFNLETRRCK